MSSRSLAAARARRAGDQAPPVSGNRPGTSIGSHAAFANMPPPSNNVRIAKAPIQQHMPPQHMMQNMPPHMMQYAQQQQQQPMPHHMASQYPQQMSQQIQQSSNGLPFSKLSISDAIGLITLRLGRVEQWIIDTDHEGGEGTSSSPTGEKIASNHKIIDISVLNNIISRLDAIEKREPGANNSDELSKLAEVVSRMGDDVTKYNITVAKQTEQLYKFERDLVETKDILKTFMIKYDLFAKETNEKFADYETALAELEKGIKSDENADDNDKADSEEGTKLDATELKDLVKQELANSE